MSDGWSHPASLYHSFVVRSTSKEVVGSEPAEDSSDKNAKISSNKLKRAAKSCLFQLHGESLTGQSCRSTKLCVSEGQPQYSGNTVVVGRLLLMQGRTTAMTLATSHINSSKPNHTRSPLKLHTSVIVFSRLPSSNPPHVRGSLLCLFSQGGGVLYTHTHSH